MRQQQNLYLLLVRTSYNKEKGLRFIFFKASESKKKTFFVQFCRKCRYNCKSGKFFKFQFKYLFYCKRAAGNRINKNNQMEQKVCVSHYLQLILCKERQKNWFQYLFIRLSLSTLKQSLQLDLSPTDDEHISSNCEGSNTNNFSTFHSSFSIYHLSYATLYMFFFSGKTIFRKKVAMKEIYSSVT